MCGHEYAAHLQGRVTQDSGVVTSSCAQCFNTPFSFLQLPFSSILSSFPPLFLLPNPFSLSLLLVSIPTSSFPSHPVLSSLPPNPLFPNSLTPAASVEQCCLEAHHTNLLQAVINSNVHGVAMIGVDIRQ